MFVERSRAQVAFSVGPFKGGTMLSHKILVTAVEGREKKNSHYQQHNVVLMDEVTLMAEDEEEDGWVLCSCFESMRDITRSWYKASLDGYIDQTKASLLNLVDLVEGGGEMIAYQSKNRYRSSYDEEECNSQVEPLLK